MAISDDGSPLNTVELKSIVEKAEEVEQASSKVATSAAEIDSHDERVLRNLETTGEEIGFTWRSIMAVVSMAMCYNAYLFSLFIPPSMLSFINADLGPDPRYTWITISWNLGGAILVTVAGRLSDLFGRRYFFLTGAVIVFIGSIVGATGHSINQMIASGAIFGIGSGFLEMALGAVQEIVPNEYRIMTIGVFEASGVIAFTTPIIAWALIDRTGTWRYAYWYMAAFQGLSIVMLFFFYHPPAFKTKHSEDGKSKMDIIKRIDYLGLLLFISGCALLIVGLGAGGTITPWVSAQTLVPIVLGFLLLVALGIWEAYGNSTLPILPPKLFKAIRQFTMPILVICISGMQYYSNASLWPRMSQLLYANGNISKGLYSEVLPLGSFIGGFLIIASKVIGHQRWFLLFMLVLQTSCVGALASASMENPTKSIMLTVIVSMCTAPAQLLSMVMIGFGIEDQRDIGTACGLAGTARLLSGALATAIYSNIIGNKYGSVLPDTVARAVSGLGFPTENLAELVSAAKSGSVAAFKTVPGITPQIQEAAVLANKMAYLEGTRLVFLVAIAFGGIGIIACWFTESIDERKYTKKTVAVMETERKAMQQKDTSLED